jgi:hypothetical protein
VQSTSQLWIWAAFEINRDYIAANLCINRFEAIPVCKGSCFLEKQLNENEKQQQKLPDLKTKEVNLFCQDNSFELPKQTFLLSRKSAYPNHNISFISSEHLRSVFRPPSITV